VINIGVSEADEPQTWMNIDISEADEPKIRITNVSAGFRIRIRLDPDSNCQCGSGSGFGIWIRIQQLKLSFFKAVEGCTDRVGTSKHLFSGGGEGCEVCVFVCLSYYQLAVMCFLIIHVEIWQAFCSAN